MAFSGLREAFLRSPESLPSPAPKKQIFLWKALLILSLLLFWFLALPRHEAVRPALMSEALLSVLNQDRQKNGLLPLAINPKLEKAAMAKARDILENDYFAHTSPTGVVPWDFIRQEGLAFRFAGENLARGYTSAYELEYDFLQSPAHRENLLSPLYSEIGIAVADGTIDGQPSVVTVQLFAAPLETLVFRQ